MSNILVIGSGGREACIIKKLLKDSKTIDKKINIFCLATNKNPFITDNCVYEIYNHLSLSILEIVLTKFTPDFAIIGPEAPLELGFSDFLESMYIPCIGPLEMYAKIETSKIFCRNIINKAGLHDLSPRFWIIPSNSDIESCSAILSSINCDIVIKKNGLCGGKGVKVQGVDFVNHDDILNELTNCDYEILIEEKLCGEEFSLMSILDGSNSMYHFPPIQDYKRLSENDIGPNTGGMGCVIENNNTLNFLNKLDIEYCENVNKIIAAELNTLNDKNTINYRGILYGSFMKCNDGKIKIIEYNARFGDPECIIALELLETNFYNLCLNICGIDKTQFNDNTLVFSKQAMICVYLVPKSYPNKTHEKFDIYLINKYPKNIHFANVEETNNHLYTLNSRSLVIFERGNSIKDCYYKIYENIKNIIGNLKYRKDIGSKFLSKYEIAGVSIDNGNNCVKEIKKFVTQTYNDNMVSSFGAFSGEFKINDLVLVSSIDGVGTKSIFCEDILGDICYVNLGKDLVRHSINDILVQGAYPLFFLDYFGCSNLESTKLINFVKGVSKTCVDNNIVLLGGETAELPNVYETNRTDMVGCIVGYKDPLFFKNTEIIKGDLLLAFKSSGPHTNGYSLIRKHLNGEKLKQTPEEILNTLVTPHKPYIYEIKHICDTYGYDAIKAMIHITGGGLKENIDRVIPESKYNYTLNLKENELPEWCKHLMNAGNITFTEMMRVFNCGVGFVIVLDKTNFSKIIHDEKLKNDVWCIGNIC